MIERYKALFKTTFLMQLPPPWSTNLVKRLVKSPKIMSCDTDLMAYLPGVDSSSGFFLPLSDRHVSRRSFVVSLADHLGHAVGSSLRTGGEQAQTQQGK